MYISPPYNASELTTLRASFLAPRLTFGLHSTRGRGSDGPARQFAVHHVRRVDRSGRQSVPCSRGHAVRAHPLTPRSPFVLPTEKVLVSLRDGRKLIGVLRSYDQYGQLQRSTCCYTRTISSSSFTKLHNSQPGLDSNTRATVSSADEILRPNGQRRVSRSRRERRATWRNREEPASQPASQPICPGREDLC